MQSVDISGLDALDRALSELLEEFPEKRRELHDALGTAAKQEVDRAITASGINDAHGNVRRWQIKNVGSGGGYAAVRPAGSSENGGTGPNSQGAITNYLENGRNVRRPSEESLSDESGYRPRIHAVYVSGYHFYQKAKADLEPKAIRIAEEFVEGLARRLEGGHD